MFLLVSFACVSWLFFFFKQKTAYEMRISDWSSDVCSSDLERMGFWAGRKAAFPAVGRIAPDFYCMDGTIPRRRLPEVLEKIQKFSRQYDLEVANVFHAGDGNLHPLILYDANIPGQLDRAEAFGSDILKRSEENTSELQTLIRISYAVI